MDTMTIWLFHFHVTELKGFAGPSPPFRPITFDIIFKLCLMEYGHMKDR